MKIDITQDSKDQTYSLMIKTDQFKTLKDYETLLNLINAISLDFDLDPEMTVEDLKTIVADAKTEDSTEVICDIGADGVDIGF